MKARDRRMLLGGAMVLAALALGVATLLLRAGSRPSSEVGPNGDAGVRSPERTALVVPSASGEVAAHGPDDEQRSAGAGAVPADATEPSPPADEGPLESIEIRGHVVDARNGRAIEGAEVFFNSPLVAASERRVAVTDAAGCFTLGRATLPEIGTVSIRARGYRFDRWWSPIFAEEFRLADYDPLETLPRDACGLRFELEPGAGVVGTVVDQAGEPVCRGFVLAYDAGIVAWLRLDPERSKGGRVDRFSSAEFFGVARSGTAGFGSVYPGLDWASYAQPHAALDEEGRFALECLPAGLEMGLLVLADDVKREIVGRVAVAEGETADRRLVVERWASIRGRLIPPDGRTAAELGLWGCDHEPCCLVGDRFDPRSDLWIPVAADGSFVAGPLELKKRVTFRVSLRAPVPPHHAEFLSAATFTAEPEELAGRFLRVDLRRPDSFLVTDEP